MLDLGKRVAAERKSGKDADAIVASLAPKIRAEHPDWSAPEWIDFAIKYYASLTLDFRCCTFHSIRSSR